MARGEYRDILEKDGQKIYDSDRRSNSIVADFGKFLAAQMKGDFNGSIKYLAVGGGGDSSRSLDERVLAFKERVVKFFKEGKPAPSGQGNWVWAKEVDPAKDIEYIDENESVVKEITNRLQVRAKFEKNEPESNATLQFKEFSLLVCCPDNNNIKISLLNYVSHDSIDKSNDMTLTRTIDLTFNK